GLQRHSGHAPGLAQAGRLFLTRHRPWLGLLSGLWDAVSSGYRGGGAIVRQLPRTGGAPHGYLHRDQWAAWNVVQLLLLVAALWLTVVAWRRLGPAFGLYSAAFVAVF